MEYVVIAIVAVFFWFLIRASVKICDDLHIRSMEKIERLENKVDLLTKELAKRVQTEIDTKELIKSLKRMGIINV